MGSGLTRRKHEGTLTAKVKGLENLAISLQQKVDELESEKTQLASRVKSLENMVPDAVDAVAMRLRLEELTRNGFGESPAHRAGPMHFSVLQYNILAGYLGDNCMPWFLYGAKISPALRKDVLALYGARGADGRVLNPGWPRYVSGGAFVAIAAVSNSEDLNGGIVVKTRSPHALHNGDQIRLSGLPKGVVEPFVHAAWVVDDVTIELPLVCTVETEPRTEDLSEAVIVREDGLLPSEAIAAVESRNAVFSWASRRQRILETVLKHRADILSLVELDDYEGFFKGELSAKGYDSVYRKRPREVSRDGCGIFWRRSQFKLKAYEGLEFDDGRDAKQRVVKDRTCVIALLQSVQETGPPLVVISTHLARNPEDSAMTKLRARQLAQLVHALTQFCDAQHVPQSSPVVLMGDFNAQHFGEIRGIARAVFQVHGKPAHSFLWNAVDVPSGFTSGTDCRKVRIDIVMYQPTLLQLIDVSTLPDLSLTGPIPNLEHPSDHLPVRCEFQIKGDHKRLRHVAKNWLDCIAGKMRLVPLSDDELLEAFNLFDRSNSGWVSPADLEECLADLDFDVSDGFVERVFGLGSLQSGGAGLTEDGFVEAYKSCLTHHRLRCQDDLERAFRFFDVNSNGELTLEELKRSLQEVSPIEYDFNSLEQLMARGGGKLTCAEFCDAIARLSIGGGESYRRKLNLVCRSPVPGVLTRRSSA
mmetsp:Transcript_47229/g.102832  ORF Transcript_47229/g.102832 Transcript_47229/m.102832 type:complete len:701 (+) Transcript_47229:46-2148(+)